MERREFDGGVLSRWVRAWDVWLPSCLTARRLCVYKGNYTHTHIPQLSLVPAAARASTGSRDEHSTCPTCARAPLSHRRRGSGTGHERRDHLQLSRDRCSQLAYGSRWRCRLRRTNAAATLPGIDGVVLDLERGVARAAPHSPFTKRKHRNGAQAHGARLRPALAGIFGKANVWASCG